jgi:hypothetical protein
MGNAVNPLLEANVYRALDMDLQDWAKSLTVPFIDAAIRDPFVLKDEDEAVSLTLQTVRKPPTRRTVYQGVFGFNIICLSKRGDMRDDGLKDRHLILASLADNRYRQIELPIFDRVGGHATTYIATLEAVEATINIVDKRLMVFGGKTDRTDDTPPTVQAVVSVSAVLIQGA